MEKYNYILTPTKLTIVGNGKHVQIERDRNDFDYILNLLKEKKFEDIIRKVDIKTFIGEYYNELLIKDDVIYYKGKPIHGVLTDRIIQFKRTGLDFEPLFNFLKNQLQNPSEESVKDLYEFIEHGNMPITSDGCFLAYKYVDADYKDCYSRTFDNHIGCICEMDRNLVNNDRNETCSTGLHVCAFDYLQNCSNKRIMIVKVNPKDVVSVPIDYNKAKMRCCKYEVVDEYVNFDKDKEFFDKQIYNEYDKYEEDVEKEHSHHELNVGEIYILKKCLNDNLRKGRTIVINSLDDNYVNVKRPQGLYIYTFTIDKILESIDKIDC